MSFMYFPTVINIRVANYRYGIRGTKYTIIAIMAKLLQVIFPIV